MSPSAALAGANRVGYLRSWDHSPYLVGVTAFASA